MLSISGPMSGAGSGNYYLELAKEDYYTAGGEPPGAWMGKGASTLGLKGEVKRDALRGLLLGFSPDRTERLVQNAGNEKRQCGWDLTFSAPKSVSVIWSQATPEVQAIIQKIQRESVQKALGYLEDVAGFSRRGRGGGQAEKVGFIAAAFEHGTSRAQDPQLHTHALLLNISTRDDGSTGTLRSRDFFRHKMAAGALYRAELAAQLEKLLHLQVHKADKSFAVTGVSEDICRQFSKRREQIEAFLKEHGVSGAVASKIAALETREVKGHMARAELFKLWRDFGKENGWGPEELQKLLIAPLLEKKDMPRLKELVTQAFEDVTKGQSYFCEREILRHVADESIGYGFSAREIQLEVAKAFRTGQVLELGIKNDETVFTTPDMLLLEKELLRDVGRTRFDSAHVVKEAKVSEELSQNPKLNTEQREAVRHITENSGTIQVVSGMAGTGKSTMLSVARKVWEDSGFTVLGAALSGKAAQGLQSSAGIKSTTIAKTLFDLARSKIELAVEKKTLFRKAPKWSPLSRIKIPRLRIRSNKNLVRLTSKTILVVDEAGMVGTRQMKTILDAAKKAGAKVVLVGDAKQLQPIDAGGPFRAIAKKLGEAKLTEIKRQEKEWAREVVTLFSQGKAGEALERCNKEGLVSISRTRAQAMNSLISDWKRDGIERPAANLILANTNAEAKALNDLAQQERKKVGRLGASPITIDGTAFHKGDRVLFTKNARGFGVMNGNLGSVTRLSEDSMTVLIDEGQEVTIPLAHYRDIRLGYAVTTYKAQGMTASNTFILAGGAMQDREISYVQASRARGDTRFYTDRLTTDKKLNKLSAAMSQSRQKELAVEIQEQQQKLRHMEHER
jgi:conjugative relaxase-like TrwC/TraI family protein